MKSNQQFYSHANFRPRVYVEELQRTGQVTLVFVNTDESWKITHEHFFFSQT